MGRFYPLYVRRSDGKKETISQRKQEVNRPTEEQLDQRPDKNGISDFYREVAPDEPKHLDWRRKIGGMLARELNVNSHHKAGNGMKLTESVLLDNGYILATFPENYRLYEHVKKTVVDGKTEVKSKTHGGGGGDRGGGGGGGGGGNDRQDAYLYGHPLGRRKRFRSPGDFFAHVLWLSTDESGDPDNCTCKICSPEELENIMPVRNRAADATKPLPASSSTTQSTNVKVKGEAPASTSTPTLTLTSTSTSTSTSIPTPTPTPTPLPQKKSQDQFFDSQYRAFMYRPGELIWFQRGQAWALGAIVRRWGQPQNAADRHYLVQPLSHPPLASQPRYPQQVIKSSELEMRPWIAWSVPRFTNEGLNNLSPPAQYSTTDWQAVRDHRFGNGDLEVDASILAAKMIDSTYTPISQTHRSQPSPGITETHHEAIFLGAEKIWRGDPIRLVIGNGIDIMVVHEILEQTSQTSSSSEPTLIFQGDVYTLTPHQHSNPALPTPASQHSNPHLPSRLTSDLAYRNARSIPRKHIAHYWKLISSQQRVGINDVKGRWYEASLILPILQPQPFADAERKGEISEASLMMNSRGDCESLQSGGGGKSSAHQSQQKRSNLRAVTRREAFKGSVPRDIEFLDGLVPPAMLEQGNVKEEEEEEQAEDMVVIDPRFETADGGGGILSHEEVGKEGASFDDLMNFEEGDVGGGNGFGGQGQGSSFHF